MTATEAGAVPALAAAGLTKRFPGVLALDDVSLRLKRGGIHALLGENGAGKSTLIKIVTGVHRPNEGALFLDGQEVAFANPRAALAAGISAVHQERNLIPRFSVAENILQEHPPSRAGLVSWRAMREEARRWLDMLDLDVDPRTPVSRLSVAQQQLVEIAKALSLRARILLLDEPTASITPHETETLFALLRRLRDEGTAILFVSHKLEEVLALCDEVTVLRDGRLACVNTPIEGLRTGDLVQLMIGREGRASDIGPPAPSGAPSALELDGIATALGHRDVSLALRPGEIVGLYGLIGAGRSELAKAIVGADRVTAGTIRVDGRPVRIGSPGVALGRYGIGYVSEDRKGEGLILAHSITHNAAITIWRRLAGVLGFLTDRRERRAVAPVLDRLAVRAPSLSRPVGTLSGGNQQKVSVAKWLAAQARVLLVDEPTVGIDVETKAALHALIHELAHEHGVAVLLISSDLAEMVALADRILVMRDFGLAAEVAGSRDYPATSRRVMAAIHDRAAPEDAA
ncbi:MAG: sugar ABC transporter ATP-binding protein [Inquilinaceae bacterium]